MLEFVFLNIHRYRFILLKSFQGKGFFLLTLIINFVVREKGIFSEYERSLTKFLFGAETLLKNSRNKTVIHEILFHNMKYLDCL